jgi:hypothetical protein
MVNFDIDTTEITAAARFAAALTGQLDEITKRSLNSTTKKVHTQMRVELNRRIDRPTTWTRRGLLARYATDARLSVAIGFNYGGGMEDFGYSGSGVPAGRYMQVQAAGGTRQLKSTEKQLAGQISINPGAGFQLRPTGEGAGKLDAYGNVKGGTYIQILSRLRALREQGSTANAPTGGGSRGRTRAKRREIDYFLTSRAGRARSIAQRVGPGPKGGTGKGSGNPGRPQTVGYRRGYLIAFQITRPQRYKSRFPLRKLALADFNRRYADAFRSSTEAMIRRAKKL